MGDARASIGRASRRGPSPIRHPTTDGNEEQRHSDRAPGVSEVPQPTRSSVDQVQELQRTAGNAAVVQWLGKGRRRRVHRVGHAGTDDRASAQDVVVAQRQQAVQRDEEASPEEEFLEDVNSGLEKAKEYLEYMPKALDYWKLVGGDMPGGLQEAAENLAKISERISGGLDKVSGVFKKAKKLIQIKKWAESMADVAEKTKALNLADKASRLAWMKSVDGLGKTSEPFVDAASDWLKGLAIEGGVVASRAFIVLGALTAYAKIGWSGLEAGMAAVDAYVDRFGYGGTEMRKNQLTDPVAIPEPAAPGPWTSSAERKASERAFMRRLEQQEKADKRRQRLAPFADKVHKAEAAIDDAKRTFDEKGFAKAYRRRRDRLLYKVAHEMRYGKRDLTLSGPKGSARIERGVGARWYDQFTNGGGEDYWDPVAGHNVTPKKESVSLEEAQYEIHDFRRVEPTCPWFNDVYAEELEKFMGKARAALKAANNEYSTAAAIAD